MYITYENSRQNMIQELSIENYLSIGGKQTLSFVATSDKSNLEEVSVEMKPGLRLLRLVLLYGANASGKTNILLAIQTIWNLLFKPQLMEHAKIPFYSPFALYHGNPTYFKIIFWALKRRYEYEVEYNEERIIREKMMYTTPGGILSKLYERNTEGEITFGSTVNVKINERNLLAGNTLPNHTVLSTLNKITVNIPSLNELYLWIKQNVHEESEHDDIYEIAREAQGNQTLKHMILEMLNKADINITEFEPLQMDLPDAMIEEMKSRGLKESDIHKIFSRREIIFTHHTDLKDFTITSSMESRGTLMYFRLARMLFDLKEHGNICLKDEIEDCLHYDLLVHYLKMYFETESHSQLVCTTHNLDLLSEDWMIRRDMVWITEKNRTSAETQLNRASSMGLHKNVSLENAFRIGKMGGKPHLGSTLIWEE